MKIFGLAIINSVAVLLTVLIHKVIYRILLLSYDSLVLYWGIFVGVFLVLNLLINIFFLKEKS
ncbi:bacteriocin-like WGxF protein [Paenibacillus illinoisensis]|uniref:Bacteriocin-like WGxF protein n=1 Tax=Paenibacillus illinoisensis TaxID=59845 RepID=A0ABW8HRR0_9BACL